MKELVKKINADVQASKGNKAAGLCARKAALAQTKHLLQPVGNTAG